MKCKHLKPEKIETELGTIYKCLDCGADITHWLRKLQNLYNFQRLYQGQGVYYTSWLQGIFNTIQTGGIIYLILGIDKSQGLAIWVFILFWLAQASIETWIGFKDFNKVKMAQRQQTLSASFSPPVKETLRILNKLNRKFFPEDNEISILEQYQKEHENKRV